MTFEELRKAATHRIEPRFTCKVCGRYIEHRHGAWYHVDPQGEN